MDRPAHTIVSPDKPPGSEVSGLALQDALQEILESPPFRTTPQCQALLKYIVTQTLAGRDHLLRERVIGSEVFGRAPAYEPGEDPIVRVRVADVRKRLAQFYQNSTGEHRMRVEIPVGSYRAQITWAKDVRTEPSPATRVELLPVSVSTAPALVEGAPDTKAVGPTRNRRLLWVSVIAALCGILGSGYWLQQMRRPSTALRAFWGPVLEETHPVLISVGSNAVYLFSDAEKKRYALKHGLDPDGPEFYMTWEAGEMVNSSDIVRAHDSFVALGDVAATTRLASFLTREGKAYEERFPMDVSFSELRESPSVFVGGFNNSKTLQFTKNLRFYLKTDKSIGDRKNGAKDWVLHNSGDGTDTEDYAIVTRLMPHPGASPIIAVAGIGQYGTLAAGEFVTNAQMIAAVAKNAPSGWERKNMQIVLGIRVVNFHPVGTEVLAADYW